MWGFCLLAGIGVMGSGEYLREFARYPHAINGYIYANDIRSGQVAVIAANGVVKTSPWVEARVNDQNAALDGRSFSSSAALVTRSVAIARCKNILEGGMRDFRARSCCICPKFATRCHPLPGTSMTAQP